MYHWDRASPDAHGGNVLAVTVFAVVSRQMVGVPPAQRPGWKPAVPVRSVPAVALAGVLQRRRIQPPRAPQPWRDGFHAAAAAGLGKYDFVETDLLGAFGFKLRVDRRKLVALQGC